MRIGWIMAAALAIASPAAAEVKSTSDSGFRLENRVTVAATPEEAWQALGEIGRWWSSAHTYSGDALNITMPLRPGACFCEALPGGGVEHGRVILVWPEHRMLRVEAALGPLQDEGIAAVLSFHVKPAPGGAQIVQTYNVGGARPEMVKMASGVDDVLAQQLASYKTYVEARP